MTDPLAGPPRYLPPELADLLTADVIRTISDTTVRRRIRRWGEACFAAGFGDGYADLTGASEDTAPPSYVTGITTITASGSSRRDPGPVDTAPDLPPAAPGATADTPLFNEVTAATATRKELPQ